MSFSLQRVENLAKKRGVSFREAARMCARKGARVRRQRQCACAQPAGDEARIMRLRWDLKGDF